MNMTGYWGKIALKALVIFGVGMIVINLVRDGKSRVERTVRSNADLTIPLPPFLPFNFDGERLGSFRRLVLHRSSPEVLEGVDLTVRLSDASSVSRLGDCPLTVDDPTRLNEHSSFQCVHDAAGMGEFGRVLVYARTDGSWRRAGSVALMLPSEVIGRLQYGSDAQAHASKLEQERFQLLADSLRTLASELVAVKNGDARAEVQTRMEELEGEMADLRRAIVEAAREQAAEAVEQATAAATAVKVEVGPEGATAVSAPKVKVVVETPKPPR